MTIDPVFGATTVALLVLLALVVSACVGLVSRVVKHRGSSGLVEQELSAAHRQLALLEREQDFLTQFIREFPHLTEQLTTRLTKRKLPEVLLEMMKRAFEPQAALVLLRRKTTAEGGKITRPLVVVRSHPANGVVERGTEIPVGQGRLGLVAEAQRTMSREDFLNESKFVSGQIRRQSLRGFKVDLAAPMVFDEKTVGVLAVSGIRRHSSADKEVLRLIAQVGAMTAFNVNAYARMKKSAELDRLTRVLNKAAITKSLSEEIIDAEKHGNRVSIFLFDIDNFKNYNDVNGHLAGDQLLASLASLIKEFIRADDSFGRFGGEEFLLILPDTDSEGAMYVAEKIRTLIAEQAFPHAQGQPLGCLSISGGVATFPDDARDSTGLLRLADESLYAAKAGGRNQVKPAQPSYIG